MTHIASFHPMKALRATQCRCKRGCLALPVAQLVLVGRAREALLIYCCDFHWGWLTVCRRPVRVCVYTRRILCVVHQGFCVSVTVTCTSSPLLNKPFMFGYIFCSFYFCDYNVIILKLDRCLFQKAIVHYLSKSWTRRRMLRSCLPSNY